VFVLGVRTSNQKGAIAEEAIASAATELGIVVCRPNTDARYDLIFDCGGRPLKIQCKWAALDGEVVVVSTRGSWFSPGRGYVVSAYAGAEVDAIAAYCRPLSTCYLLPVDLVDGQTQVHLRLSDPRNGQRAAVHFAADYPLGAVAQLEERLAGSEEARGSSPLSSIPIDAAAVVVGAHQFRNRFGWYMERASAGQEIQITRHGRPFARLLPPTAGSA
jgi:prevent-host-death family protein